MNLYALKKAVDYAIEMAADHGERPEDIPVSLQIDDPDNPNDGYVCAEDVVLHYDGNCDASGCVLQAWREPIDDDQLERVWQKPDRIEQVLQAAGYETVSGAEGVRAAIASVMDGSTEQRCSGHGVFPDGSKCEGCGDCRHDT